MTIFKSRQINLDPEPWVLAFETNHRLSNEDYFWETRTAVLRPRPEFEPTRDPNPWLCDYKIDGKPVRSFFDGHGRYTWAPRREQFDTPVNRVLVHLREERRDIYDLMLNLDSRWAEGFTPGEVEHAWKVLDRLAAF